MMGSEVLDAAGIQPPPYYAMLDRADRLLDAPGGGALDATVQDGIDSLARLYLNGRPLPKLPPAPEDVQANTAIAAHATAKETIR
jgi:hypothetical protein